ncbi:MAG: hypothetical protein ACE5HS_11000 [bacterium]
MDNFAQPVGSPIFSASRGELTLSFNGGYLVKSIQGVENDSPRFLAKAVYGLTSYLELFAVMGAAKINLDLLENPSVNYRDDYHLAFGAGLTLRVFHFKPAKFYLFLNGQVFRFTGKPAHEDLSVVSNSEVMKRSVLEYDWREVLGSAGSAKRFGKWRFIAGVQGKIIQRNETKTTIFSIIGNTGTQNIQHGTYKSGLQFNPILGVEFQLPSRFKLNLEVIGHRSTDFMINVGISQTGKPS